MSAQATLLAVVATQAQSLIRIVESDATNVSALLDRPPAPAPPDEVAALWPSLRRKPPVYALVGFDPLEALVAAWSGRLEGTSDDLEVLIGLSGRLELPDYYLVEDGLESPRRLWYFELLHARASARVIPFDGTVGGITEALRRLPRGRALPDASEVTRAAREFVPGTTGLRPPTTTSMKLSEGPAALQL